MMRIDAGVNPRAAGPALAPDGAAGQYGAATTPATNGARNEAGNEAGAIRITPSRRIVERRDPAISFKVTAAGFSAFDILLTTDPALFEARNADRRTAANFRSSRQDFDGESIPAEIGFYMTPTAFLGALAAATPRPERLYYVAVGYRGDERTSGVFSTPAETLADLAPYVQLAANLGGASLSAVLGAAVERLGQVGAGRRITGARPLSQVGMPRQSIGGLPVHGSRDGARQINGGAPPERPAEAGPARQTPDPAPEEAPPARPRSARGRCGQGAAIGASPGRGQRCYRCARAATERRSGRRQRRALRWRLYRRGRRAESGRETGGRRQGVEGLGGPALHRQSRRRHSQGRVSPVPERRSPGPDHHLDRPAGPSRQGQAGEAARNRLALEMTDGWIGPPMNADLRR
ncbi:MAG: hypothetical protein IIC03_11800 [Proteobacteria bacterium]|nr:hypothetical protein [Pseudomonadota bacterium]